MSNQHHEFMLKTLILAKKGLGFVSPNPAVGCLIVKNNHIVGQGYHQYAGGPHAEIYALQEAENHAQDATAYISLEPCCHTGKTPPCTLALINAGIKTVYIACLDQNPLVAGKGIAALKAAGIEVNLGLCEEEAIQLNEAFFYAIKHKKPFVIAKWAMSLDGKTITQPLDSKQISNFASQQNCHQLRQQVDAIIIGAKTAIQDDPLLTVRHLSEPPLREKQPLRIIVSSNGDLPLHLRLFDTSLPGKTIIATTHAISSHLQQQWAEKDIECLILSKNNEGGVNLHALLETLIQRDIISVLVEGGNILHQQFFNENLVSKIQVYLAPIIIGSLKNRQIIKDYAVESLDRDLCLTSYPQRGEHYV